MAETNLKASRVRRLARVIHQFGRAISDGKQVCRFGPGRLVGPDVRDGVEVRITRPSAVNEIQTPRYSCPRASGR
jgi:hypothetical protein